MLHSFRNELFESRLISMPPGPEAVLAGIHVTAIGRHRCTGRFRYRQLATCHVVHVILEGSGEMTVNGTTQCMNPGSMFVFHPDDHAFYATDPHRPWFYAFAVFEGVNTAAAFREALIGPADPRLFSGGFHALLAPILERYELAGLRHPPYTWQAPATAWQLLAAIAGERGQGGTPDPDDRIRHARNIIDREAVNGLTVASLATTLNVDRTTLYRRFTALFGISPKACIDDNRLRHAVDMLRGTECSIKEIAYACGWTSARDFSRAFRRRFGSSPAGWRTGRGTVQNNESADASQ